MGGQATDPPSPRSVLEGARSMQTLPKRKSAYKPPLALGSEEFKATPMLRTRGRSSDIVLGGVERGNSLVPRYAIKKPRALVLPKSSRRRSENDAIPKASVRSMSCPPDQLMDASEHGGRRKTTLVKVTKRSTSKRNLLDNRGKKVVKTYRVVKRQSQIPLKDPQDHPGKMHVVRSVRKPKEVGSVSQPPKHTKNSTQKVLVRVPASRVAMVSPLNVPRVRKAPVVSQKNLTQVKSKIPSKVVMPPSGSKSTGSETVKKAQPVSSRDPPVSNVKPDSLTAAAPEPVRKTLRFRKKVDYIPKIGKELLRDELEELWISRKELIKLKRREQVVANYFFAINPSFKQAAEIVLLACKDRNLKCSVRTSRRTMGRKRGDDYSLSSESEGPGMTFDGALQIFVNHDARGLESLLISKLQLESTMIYHKIRKTSTTSVLESQKAWKSMASIPKADIPKMMAIHLKQFSGFAAQLAIMIGDGDAKVASGQFKDGCAFVEDSLSKVCQVESGVEQLAL